MSNFANKTDEYEKVFLMDGNGHAGDDDWHNDDVLQQRR